MKRKTGIFEKLESVESFVPHPLPPRDPEFDFNEELAALYGQAMLSLGQLNEVAHRVPDSRRFIKAYVIKEAMLSSAIEGIHTTLLDVFTQPLGIENKISKETQLVLNYTHALDVALDMVVEQHFPIVSRVILQAHKTLMSGGEGEKADPGSYRKQGVRVGSFVPAPAREIPRLIADLEQYINVDESLPPLIKAGLAHVQFEIIHPFLDGNGRIGRLLIVLMMVNNGLIHAPVLYPSYYFKKHHAEYYHRLNRVSSAGDFEGWIAFYLKAIHASSVDAYTRARDIELLEKTLVQQIKEQISLPQTALAALDCLFQFPVCSVAHIATHVDKSYNTANAIVQQFVAMGLLQETTAKRRSRLYRFVPYLDLLEKEYGVAFE